MLSFRMYSESGLDCSLGAHGLPNIKLSWYIHRYLVHPPANCYCKNVCMHFRFATCFTLCLTAFRAPSLCRRRATCPRLPQTPGPLQPSDEIDHPPHSIPTHCEATRSTIHFTQLHQRHEYFYCTHTYACNSHHT